MSGIFSPRSDVEVSIEIRNANFDLLAALDKVSILGIGPILTLLIAEWVGMEALENKNHTSPLCFFVSVGAIRQISNLESVSNKVVTHQNALSAWFFQLPRLPINSD